jgi:murein DD-endopeptidase MepM/ murein hydrolase activator NlpD
MQITPFLYFPVKNPIDQQNLFGTSNAMYTALGQKGHPGIDFECPSGTPVYAPCDGDVFYVTDKDGGCGLWIRTPSNDPDNLKYNVILWHMYPKDTEGFPYAIPTDGSVTGVKAGQMLGYSDNSGYPIESTGPHLHVGLMPCDSTGEAISPTNGYLGCIDPAPWFNGEYAEDINNPPPVPTAQVVENVKQAVATLTTANIPVAQKETFLDELEALLMKYL